MIFSQEEFNSRIAKVKKSMHKRGVDILLTTDPSNMNYLTGYDGWSFYVPQGVIISICLLYTSPSPRDRTRSRMPSSA